MSGSPQGPPNSVSTTSFQTETQEPVRYTHLHILPEPSPPGETAFPSWTDLPIDLSCRPRFTRSTHKGTAEGRRWLGGASHWRTADSPFLCFLRNGREEGAQPWSEAEKGLGPEPQATSDLASGRDGRMEAWRPESHK